jgi:hypothetical protein
LKKGCDEMSRGYGGFGIKESENDEFVVYAYSSFNWNDEKHYNDERICDGRITISKKAIAVCEEESLEISFVNLYNQKGVIIENCSNTWIQEKSGMDFISLYLCSKILASYQEEHCFPEKCHYVI